MYNSVQLYSVLGGVVFHSTTGKFRRDSKVYIHMQNWRLTLTTFNLPTAIGWTIGVPYIWTVYLVYGTSRYQLDKPYQSSKLRIHLLEPGNARNIRFYISLESRFALASFVVSEYNSCVFISVAWRPHRSIPLTPVRLPLRSNCVDYSSISSASYSGANGQYNLS